MSYDLLTWNAWARNATPDEIAAKLTQQQAEVARLRSVCRMAAWSLEQIELRMVAGNILRRDVAALVADLTAAGKEATGGQ